MLNLLPEQQQYVDIECIPLLLLKGTAGSGKTTIGIYRAIHLAGQGQNVLMLAFGSTLSSVTRSLIEELIGPISENLQVRTLHSLMKEILLDRQVRLNIPGSEKAIRNHLQEALSQVHTRNNQVAVLKRDENFFQEKWACH